MILQYVILQYVILHTTSSSLRSVLFLIILQLEPLSGTLVQIYS